MTDDEADLARWDEEGGFVGAVPKADEPVADGRIALALLKAE